MTKDRRYTGTLATLRSRHAASVARRRLAGELAAFTTAADRLELDAMLERAEDRDAEYVRAVVNEVRARHAA